MIFRPFGVGLSLRGSVVDLGVQGEEFATDVLPAGNLAVLVGLALRFRGLAFLFLLAGFGSLSLSFLLG